MAAPLRFNGTAAHRPTARSGFVENVAIDGARVQYRLAGRIGKTATIVVTGLLGVSGAYSELTDAIAEQSGRAAICIRQSRTQGIRSLSPHALLHPDGLLPQSVLGVMGDAQRKYGIELFDLLGHSMGGLAVFRATLRQLQQNSGPTIRSIHLLEAAGTTEDWLLTYALHAPKMLSEARQVAQRSPQLGVELLGFIARNPLRLAGETLHTSLSRLDPQKLHDIGRQGIRTTAVNYVRDPWLPGLAAEQRIGQAVDVFTLGNPEVAGHFAPQLYPEAVAAEYLQTRSLVS